MADWTPQHVAACLVEAAETVQRLPAAELERRVARWPAALRGLSQSGVWGDDVLAAPTAVEVDRLEQAMTWLAWLEDDEARLLWLRAEGVRWKLIAHRLRADRSTLWRRWQCARAKIASRLDALSATQTSQQNPTGQTRRDLTESESGSGEVRARRSRVHG